MPRLFLPAPQANANLKSKAEAMQQLAAEANQMRGQLAAALDSSAALERHNAELERRVELLQVGLIFPFMEKFLLLLFL